MHERPAVKLKKLTKTFQCMNALGEGIFGRGRLFTLLSLLAACSSRTHTVKNDFNVTTEAAWSD